MLAMSDTPIAQFIPYFAKASVPVAFLVPTPTGYEKSIMDATAPIRQLLFDAQVHDYEAQEQGPSNKVLIPAHFVNYSDVTDSVASLYRPVTKKGDPRIWFSNLRKYCSPCNLLAIVVINKELYVFNLSKPEIAAGIQYNGFAASIIQEAAHQERAIAEELLGKLRIMYQHRMLIAQLWQATAL